MLSILAIFGLTVIVYGQTKVELNGTIFDKENDETVVGAKIVCDKVLITKSDIDGKYALQVDANKVHQLTITCIGFDTMVLDVKVGAWRQHLML